MSVVQGEPVVIESSVEANFTLYVERSAYELYNAYVFGDRTASAVQAYQTIAQAVEKMHLAGLLAGLHMPQAVTIKAAEVVASPNKVSRETVFDAIDSERFYQLGLWGENPHSITEFLTYIRDYVEEALHATCRLADRVANPKALGIVRKVGALATACMEQHGAPRRDLNDLTKAWDEHQVPRG